MSEREQKGQNFVKKIGVELPDLYRVLVPAQSYLYIFQCSFFFFAFLGTKDGVEYGGGGGGGGGDPMVESW